MSKENRNLVASKYFIESTLERKLLLTVRLSTTISGWKTVMIHSNAYIIHVQTPMSTDRLEGLDFY